MTKNTKEVLLAIAILIIDFAIFFFPVMAGLAFCVVLAKPKWFKKFIDELYREE